MLDGLAKCLDWIADLLDGAARLVPTLLAAFTMTSSLVMWTVFI